MHINIFQFFGVPFDPWDGEDRVALKRAYICSSISTPPCFSDPYDALTWHLRDLFVCHPFEKLGKVPVESWLTPTPKPEDLSLVTTLNYAVFLDSNGCKEYADKVKDFVHERIEGTPVMIGVDHSSTGGVVEALTERYDANNLSLVILDSHSDFLPMELRYEMIQYQRKTSKEMPPPYVYDPFSLKRPESYNSGNFVYHLIRNRIIPPDRIILMGVSDRPPTSAKYEDPAVTKAIEFYYNMEEQGVQIITRNEVKKKGLGAIRTLLRKRVKSLHFYLSIDIDIGAISAIYGARQILEPPIIGLNTRELYRLAKAFASFAGGKDVKLVGLDLMETDVYRAGMLLRNGKTDRTYEVEANLLKRLLEANKSTRLWMHTPAGEIAKRV